MKNDLKKFEATQNLAYEAALAVSQLLQEGMTEKDVANLLDRYCRDLGVKSYFHKPFAWFGDRTRYLNFSQYWHFLSGSKVLKKGYVVILDVAPIFDGHVADIGYTFVFGENEKPQLKEAKSLLLDLREELPKWFESKMTTSEIWAKCDEVIKERGFENIHQMYPFEVLGHKVHKVPFGKLPSITFPFGWHSFWSLGTRGIFSELLGPKHKGTKVGMWAIEPHIGGDGFGAKFEEILVVEETETGNISAKWLSNNVPHLNPDWFVA